MLHAIKSLKDRRRRSNCQIVWVTGQSGDRKGELLEAAAQAIEQRTGKPTKVFHVGHMMAEDDPEIESRLILKSAQSQLRALRRLIWLQIFEMLPKNGIAIINDHATFSWVNGHDQGYDLEMLQIAQPDLCVSVLENFYTVANNLKTDMEIELPYGSILSWRDTEADITKKVTEALFGEAAVRGMKERRFYVFPRGKDLDGVERFVRLVTEPDLPKCYPSFPMTHVKKLPDARAEIDGFRARLWENYLAWDPALVDEHGLIFAAKDAAEKGMELITVAGDDGGEVTYNVADLLAVRRQVEQQIVDRDENLIAQSNFVASYLPVVKVPKVGTIPLISSGVEWELQFASRRTRPTFLVCPEPDRLSPFHSHPHWVGATVDECLAALEQSGYKPCPYEPPSDDDSADSGSAE